MSFPHLIQLANESGGTLYLMLFLFLLALTVIIERWRYLANMYQVGEKAIAMCRSKKIVDKKTLQEFHEVHTEHPLLSLLSVAIDGEHDHLSKEELSGNLEEALMHEVPKLDRSLWLLDTIITLAPLLGLFGTIIGMFNAFSMLGDIQSGIAQVTGGIAEALIATASGLVIAMVGLFFFNNLNVRIREVVHQMETLKVMILNRQRLFTSNSYV
jgi:biopolymer transport protein ExbB